MKNAIAPTAHIYDDRVHVPLILSGYNVPTKNIITQQVQSVDIFPTIAGIIGLLNTNYGRRGHSLVPLLKNGEIEEFPAFLESATNSKRSSDSNVIGIRTSEYKYFRDRNEKTKNVHLYDLKNDPLEEHNVCEKNHDLVKKMEITIEKILQSKSLEHDESKDLSKEEMKKARAVLSKLGYI
jgi:arylsulfatase A-like enzyme